MIIGNVSAIMGILSGLGLVPDSLNTWPGVAAIPFGNPNFYGSMMCLVDATAIGLIVYGNAGKERMYAIASLVLSDFATWTCDSSSPIVGNVMVFVIILFMETLIRIRHKDKARYRRVLLMVAACIGIYLATAVIINTARSNSVQGEINSNINTIREAERTETPILEDTMFSNRMGIWKYCFERIPEFWYLGIGPENLWIITTIESGAPMGAYTFDKAHNEYINVMISEGIPAIIIYLVFLFMLFIPGLKNWKKKGEKGPVMLTFFLAYFSYIAQAFFNISVIQVAPYFWLICGLLASENSKDV